MATDKPRYTVSVDDELFKQIEDFRFSNRYNNRADATVALLRAGLEAISNMTPEELEERVTAFREKENKKKGK